MSETKLATLVIEKRTYHPPWWALLREDTVMVKVTPKRIRIMNGRDMVFDRASGALITRRKFRSGMSYRYSIKLHEPSERS